jgi:probable biosynthetic protein (TIGR04098 family)
MTTAHSIRRRVTLTPSMTGHNDLFLAQVADWTWESVSAMCGTETYRERNEHGSLTFLSFVYLRISAPPDLQPHHFTFGDAIDVVTTAYRSGNDAIVTRHVVTHASRSLSIETLNRWVTRSRPDSNELVRSTPQGFDTSNLPILPDDESPRAAYDLARKAGTFHDVNSPDYELFVDDFAVDYTIDAARDLNGVGLVFFASFASIIDSALLRLWRHLGRDTTSFLSRIVREQQIAFTANAAIDATLRITLRAWRRREDPRDEVFNVVVRDPARGRVVVVSTLHVVSAELP